MSFEVETIAVFDRQAKRLSKRYASFKSDLLALIKTLELDPQQGTALGKGCYKVRLNIKSKGRGKSKGARVITNIKITDKKVFLLTVYDKADQSTIYDHEIKILLEYLK